MAQDNIVTVDSGKRIGKIHKCTQFATLNEHYPLPFHKRKKERDQRGKVTECITIAL